MMTLAWAQRQEEVLRDCIVSPDVFNSMVDRLRDFVVPYQHALCSGDCYPLFFQLGRYWARGRLSAGQPIAWIVELVTQALSVAT